MKNAFMKGAIFFLMIASIFSFSFFIDAENAESLSAQEIVLGTGGIVDENLYAALLEEKNNTRPNGAPLYTSLDEDDFKDITSLDLSDKDITTITGLNRFDLSGLEVLDLSGNSIEKIVISGVANLTNIISLDVSDNDLVELGLATHNELNTLKLNNNNLTHIDLSKIKTNNAKIILDNNNFEDAADIIFPDEELTGVSIGLDFNYIVEKIESTHNIMNNIAFNNLLVNRENAENISFTGETKISLLRTDELSDSYSISLYDDATNLKIADLTKTNSEVLLDIGIYEIEGKLLDGSDYKFKFSVLPTIPKFALDGEKLDEGLYSLPLGIKVNISEGYTGYYTLNTESAKVIENGEIKLENKGVYHIKIWQEKDGIASAKVSISLETTDFHNPFLSGLAIFMVIVIFGGAIYFRIYIRKKGLLPAKKKKGKKNGVKEIIEDAKRTVMADVEAETKSEMIYANEENGEQAVVSENIEEIEKKVKTDDKERMED